MNEATSVPVCTEVSATEFEAVRRLLYAQSGIALSDKKSDMVQARLARRLRAHRIESISAYLEVVKGDATGAEMQEFINCLTTNKTDFFRESHHFEYLRDVTIPAWEAEGRKRIRIWSAASSTGEEPYSLAATLAASCRESKGWDVRILASDIDTDVLATAARGIYSLERLRGVPPEILRFAFLKGKGANAGQVAVRPEVHELVAFRKINLTAEDWPIRVRFDAIFCRNVVIYFDRPTQEKLIGRMANLLQPGGLLFMGHSENLHWMADRFVPLGGTIYRRRGEKSPSPAAKPKPAEKISAEPERNIVLGDVEATSEPSVLKTLLGSCVSACIYDPVAQVGGMNHFSLPGVSDDGVCSRYGAHAMELLVTAVMKRGGDRSRLRAKVFGGANVLNLKSKHLNVGAKNSAFVLHYLKVEGIPIETHCLGGELGLNVRFRPHTGQAYARPIAPRDLTRVAGAEARYESKLTANVTTRPIDDGIELF